MADARITSADVLVSVTLKLPPGFAWRLVLGRWLIGLAAWVLPATVTVNVETGPRAVER